MNHRKPFLLFAACLFLAGLVLGCKSVRQAQPPTGPSTRILTYNVNWGGPRPDLAVEIIRDSGAEIVCLQETTPDWKTYLRANASRDYPFMDFRNSKDRMGGGLAFMSKTPMQEVAYIPSITGWFDGWIMAFETGIGKVQVLNVHLRPQVGNRGSWTVSGYLFTGDERSSEIQRFYQQLAPALPTIVAGDFNDTDRSAPVTWLLKQGFTDGLREFDRRSPTWEWKTGPVYIRRRLDHILYSPQLVCSGARIIRAGASDHVPVLATFEQKPGPAPRRE